MTTTTVSRDQIAIEIKKILDAVDKNVSPQFIGKELDKIGVKVEKKTINSILYANEWKLSRPDGIFVKKQDIPPLWTVSGKKLIEKKEEKKEVKEGELITVVLVNLGHIHNIVSEIEKLNLDENLFKVNAYADYAYNGPEVAADQRYKLTNVWRSSDDHSSAADTKAIWDAAIISDQIKKSKQQAQFIVVSKSKAFQPLKQLISAQPDQKLDIVTSWDELKIFLE